MYLGVGVRVCVWHTAKWECLRCVCACVVRVCACPVIVSSPGVGPVSPLSAINNTSIYAQHSPIRITHAQIAAHLAAPLYAAAADGRPASAFTRYAHVGGLLFTWPFKRLATGKQWAKLSLSTSWRIEIYSFIVVIS